MHASSFSRVRIAAALLGSLLVWGAFGVSTASAYVIEDIGAGNHNDFVLQPAKLELVVDPGAMATRDLSVVNRTNEARVFHVEVEDFTGSNDPAQTVLLLGTDTGPASLRQSLHPETNTFTLQPGEKITFKVSVDVPATAEPGGLYGSVLVSSSRPGLPASGEGASAGAVVTTRLGALFLVRVSGQAKEDAMLENFTVDHGRSLYFVGGPEQFTILFRNKGNVHEDPYGTVTIRNLVGASIGSIDVEPYFSMPNSLRSREVPWAHGFLFGRYTATLVLHRGYGDLVDTREIAFWVLPWKLVLSVFAGILLIALLVRFIFSRFEIRRK